MQELHYYLNPVDTAEALPRTLGSEVVRPSDDIDYTSINVFLLSIPDDKNREFSALVRNELFALYPHFCVSICDLGSLKIGDTIKDTLHSFRYVSDFVTEMGKVLLVLDTNFITDLLPLMNLKQSSRKCTALTNSFNYPAHLNCSVNLLKSKTHPDAFVGLQNFLSSQNDYLKADQANVLIHRLGEIIESPKSVEPVLRDSSSCFLSLSILERSNEFLIKGGSVNGVSTHNICQLSYYAGRSSSLTHFFTDGNSLCKSQSDSLTASLISQIAWNFIFGQSQKLHFDKTSKTYKSYYVANFHDDVDFCFYEDTSLNIWWLEITIAENTYLISTTSEDYKKMQNGEIPKYVSHTISSL